MFLFVSYARFKRAGVGKAGLFAAILMLSLSAQAESSDTAEKAVSDDQAPDIQKQNVQPQHEQAKSAGQHGFHFPNWPQRKKTNKEVIPPPPPGPYMSSALSDYSLRAPSFGRDHDKYERQSPVNRSDSVSAAMDTFSPDVPWPKNLRHAKHKHKHKSPERWIPENGYQYVEPQPGNYSLGSNQGPRMKGMNMSGARWMPSMGTAQQGPYNTGQNFAPVYGPNYGPRYGRPAVNNNGVNSANPPYPRSNKPRYPDQGS